MKVICKIAADCPKNLKICCGTCDDRDTCEMCCASCGDWESCTETESVNDGLTRFQGAVPDTIEKMTALLKLKQELDEQEKHLKQRLLEAMEMYGVESFETDTIRLKYVAPTTRTAIDTTKLKKDLPDIAERYTKTSAVSASVRITVK